jgi:hypothetical protein
LNFRERRIIILKEEMQGRQLSAPPKGKVSSTGRLLKACPTGGRLGSNACGEEVTLVETGARHFELIG